MSEINFYQQGRGLFANCWKAQLFGPSFSHIYWKGNGMFRQWLFWKFSYSRYYSHAVTKMSSIWHFRFSVRTDQLQSTWTAHIATVMSLFAEISQIAPWYLYRGHLIKKIYIKHLNTLKNMWTRDVFNGVIMLKNVVQKAFKSLRHAMLHGVIFRNSVSSIRGQTITSNNANLVSIESRRKRQWNLNQNTLRVSSAKCRPFRFIIFPNRIRSYDITTYSICTCSTSLPTARNQCDASAYVRAILTCFMWDFVGHSL